jgi:hypothetical protein
VWFFPLVVVPARAANTSMLPILKPGILVVKLPARFPSLQESLRLNCLYQFSSLKWMAQAMEVSLKTENEECAGMTLQIRGSEGGRRGFTDTCQLGITWRVPR